MKYKDSLYLIWSVKYGDTDKLLRRIGNKNFSAIKRKGYIVCGVIHPEVWKISEKGKEFCNALFNCSWVRRIIDNILIKILL